MRISRVAAVIVAMMIATSAFAQLDVDALNEAYREFDMERRDGEGYSDSTDSGTLGWSQGSIMIGYINMWEGTGDTYWLGKISEHFHRIMENAVDLEGDGFRSWYTTGYNEAVAWTDRLHNVSSAEAGPAFQRIRGRDEAAKATGHTYLIDFLESADVFRVVDWDRQEVIAEALEHDGVETQVAAIEPFTVTISGETHQGDRFLVRTKAPEPTRFTVHQGRFIYPVARLIETVQQTPELQEQFGADAAEFLEFINHHVFEKNERDWLEMGELGGAYRFEPKITDRFANRVMPHNQYAELARVWLVLMDVEGAHPLMADRAEKAVRYFQSHLELNEEHDAWTWHYWNWIEAGEPGASGIESTNYASIDTGFAAEAARRGVVFTDEDMQRFVNTWLHVMWNQDEEEPMLASNVEGREPDRFTALTAGFIELAEWEPRIHELALTAFLAREESARVTAAPGILLSAVRAGELEGH